MLPRKLKQCITQIFPLFSFRIWQDEEGSAIYWFSNMLFHTLNLQNSLDIEWGKFSKESVLWADSNVKTFEKAVKGGFLLGNNVRFCNHLIPIVQVGQHLLVYAYSQTWLSIPQEYFPYNEPSHSSSDKKIILFIGEGKWRNARILFQYLLIL